MSCFSVLLEANPSILQEYGPYFDDLPIYFEGDSRILKEVEGTNYLIGKLKPTIFSIEAAGPVPLEGIDLLRLRLNHLFCTFLDVYGIKTAMCGTFQDLMLMTKEEVAPIEVVVKSKHVGSPKHLYKHMDKVAARDGRLICPGSEHPPYVRFDWRNPLPYEDACMPEQLADAFIDTEAAKETALKAFDRLAMYLKAHDFRLVDICFFMSRDGRVICGEVSTDNTRIEYIGSSPDLIHLFQRRDKEAMIEKASALLFALQEPRIILSGPFCTGKTTLIKRAEKELEIPKLIDDTTRNMRSNESEGFPYRFLTKEQFERNLEENRYFEWVNFHGNYYGVPRDDLFFKRTWIMDILSSSVPQYIGKIPGLITIYLAPPKEEVLIQRARMRGDTEESIKRRLDAMRSEDSSIFDYTIPDGDIEEKWNSLKKVLNFSVSAPKSTKIRTFSIP